jgi:hypothetical protein
MCFFWGIKTAYFDMLAVEHYLRAPFSLVKRYASEARCIVAVWLAYIMQILRSAHITKIVKSVVNFVAVYMVDMVIRPFIHHVKPSQPMRAVSSAFDRYAPITRFHLIPGDTSCVFASKNTGVGVVAKFFSENLSRQHVASFDAEVLP